MYNGDEVVFIWVLVGHELIIVGLKWFDDFVYKRFVFGGMGYLFDCICDEWWLNCGVVVGFGYVY